MMFQTSTFQSVVQFKVFSPLDGSGNRIKAEVVHYESDDVQVYEVLTEEDTAQEEGTEIFKDFSRRT